MNDQMTIFEMDKIELIENDGLYSLTDLWKKSGSIDSKNPSRWMKRKGTQEFICYIKGMNKNTPVFKIVNGDGGGTFANWQVSLAYAKYLSPELHAKVNKVFKDNLEEKADPNLAVNRGIDRAKNFYEKQGKGRKWTQNRIIGITKRHHYTDTLSNNGCDGKGIGWGTNEIYKPVIGGTAKESKRSRNLPEKANLRDNLTDTELLAISLAESLACDKIEGEGLNGNYKCAMASKKAIDNTLRVT